MFWEHPTFPFALHLERHADEIRAEARRLSVADYVDWHDGEAYSEGWKIFGLYARDVEPQSWTLAHNASRCPRTAAVLARIPGLLRASFSMLMPGAHVNPHADSFQDRLRCCLGLWTPGAGIRFDGKDLRRCEGRCLVFDGHALHEADDLGAEPRVVMLIDVERGQADTPIA